MANKRVFVAFAVEDKNEKDLFVGQAKNKNVPFEFIDMSVKEPFDTAWKTQCRSKIKGCSGFIALISENSKQATGQLWEIDCAKEERIKMRGIYIKRGSFLNKPTNMVEHHVFHGHGTT